MPGPGAPYELSLCALVQNEAPYIAEWIAYHRLLGFEHFFIYDNHSNDDLDAKLAPFIAKGWVTVIRIPERHGTWLQNHCFEPDAPSQNSRWLASMDVDEFLVVAGGMNASIEYPTLPQYLNLYEDFGCAGLVIDRFRFGSGPHHVKPKHGLVIENYKERYIVGPQRGNQWGKTFAFVERVRKQWVHTLEVYNGWNVCLADGGSWDGGMRSDIFEPLRIQHYNQRSEEECFEKQARRALDSPSDWRVNAGRSLCSETVHGGEGYEPKFFTQDLTLAESQWPSLVKAFLKHINTT